MATARRMKSEGASEEEIARALNRSTGTVSHWITGAGKRAIIKECKYCSQPFQAVKKNAQFCTSQHRDKYRQEQKKADREARRTRQQRQAALKAIRERPARKRRERERIKQQAPKTCKRCRLRPALQGEEFCRFCKRTLANRAESEKKANEIAAELKRVQNKERKFWRPGRPE
jgi:hypothetical protein